MRKIFYDTEFIEDGKTIDLISIGMVDDQGREFYAANRDAPWKRIAAHPWLPENVVRHLPLLHGDARMDWSLSRGAMRRNPCMLDFAHPHMKSRATVAQGVLDFLAPSEDWHDLELWAYYGAYDHVVLAQLWGTMMHLPEGVPMFTHELMQEWMRAGCPAKPLEPTDQHNALADARWNRDLHRVITARCAEARGNGVEHVAGKEAAS